MSAPKISAPRGTFDVLGPEARQRAELERAATEILQGAGYERIETPCFEATELFARGVGESTDIVSKEMYTFKDGSDRSLTLRPEGTAPVCRAYVEHGMQKRPQPVKLWYLGSFFRYERAQKGRYRQFWQVGAEALGSDDPALDAESIVLLRELLLRMGAKDLRLRLASLGGAETRASYRELLQAHLRANEESLSEDVRARIELNPLRAFDSQHPGTLAAMKQAPLLLDHLDVQDRDHFAQVKSLLDAVNVPYQVDPTLVRGLDYYERTVFEFTSDALGAQSGVGGGGRYDGLVAQLGGPQTPGIGWAAGVERILLAGGQEPPQPRSLDVYICVADSDRGDGERSTPSGGAWAGLRSGVRERAFMLLGALRSVGLRVEMEQAGRSLKGQLTQADRRGARYAAIFDGEGSALRDLRGGGQRELDHDALLQELQTLLSADA
ncbi:MAG TPA: histidine--tRNA ligase [Solirubrobacteraceae bacterium]